MRPSTISRLRAFFFHIVSASNGFRRNGLRFSVHFSHAYSVASWQSIITSLPLEMDSILRNLHLLHYIMFGLDLCFPAVFRVQHWTIHTPYKCPGNNIEDFSLILGCCHRSPAGSKSCHVHSSFFSKNVLPSSISGISSVTEQQTACILVLSKNANTFTGQHHFRCVIKYGTMAFIYEELKGTIDFTGKMANQEAVSTRSLLWGVCRVMLIGSFAYNVKPHYFFFFCREAFTFVLCPPPPPPSVVHRPLTFLGVGYAARILRWV